MFRVRNDCVEPLSNNEYLLGFNNKCRYNDYSVNYEKGDRLFLYSDGFTDMVFNTKNPETAIDKFARMLILNKKRSASEFLENLSAENFSVISENLPDDLTIAGIDFL